jgi:hypothetical protein
MDTLALGGIQDRLDRPGHTGLLREAGKPTLREGMQGVADGLDATADVLGNLRWRVLLRAREQNLAPAQCERLFGT